MELPSRGIHIRCRFCAVKSKQLDRELRRVLGLDSSLTAGFEELLNSGVAEALDHACSVTPRASPVKGLHARMRGEGAQVREREEADGKSMDLDPDDLGLVSGPPGPFKTMPLRAISERHCF
jgi:hypothetical protein